MGLTLTFIGGVLAGIGAAERESTWIICGVSVTAVGMLVS